jgi:two-component system sensor histidine kinase YesM
MKKIKEKLLGLKLNIKFTAVIIVIVMIPIAILAGILFHNMKINVVDDNLNYMNYTMERSYDQILTNVNAINMTTQFFLNDSGLLEYLKAAKENRDITTQEKLEFYNEDIPALERLVNNNPSLYQIRVYAMNDNVQEMMPVLYNSSRMHKLSWASDKELSGWKFDYKDKIFASYTLNQNGALISLVTLITDYEDGQIGTIEAAMKMETMFPSLYENIENEWSCLVDQDQNLYFGDNQKKESQEIVERILKKLGGTTQETNFYMEINDRKLVVACKSIKEIGVTLISVNDITREVSYVYRMSYIFIGAIIIIMILLVFVINAVVKYLLRQFYDIIHSIREVQKGDLDVVIENCGDDEMGELGTQINKMLSRIKGLMEDNIKRELLVKNSEIRSLQNQIDSHFIYNVLESIKMMAEIEEEYEISNAITSLGKLLRYSMKWRSATITVGEEIEYIKDYLALINLRFDYEIYLSLNLPEIILKQEIPKMSLQPIVENAIYHGIEQMAEDTNIYIKGIVLEKDCVIEITDAGKGMSEEEVAALYKKMDGEVEPSGGSGNGIGLKNVRDRIKMTFGPDYGIEIASKSGCYTKVSVRIPLKQKEDIEIS